MWFDTDHPPPACRCGDDARPARWYRPSLAVCRVCGGLAHAFQHQTWSSVTRAGVSSKTRTRKWDANRGRYVAFRPLLGAVSSKTRTRKWDANRGRYVAFRPLLGAR